MTDSIVVLHVDDEPDFASLTADFLERENERIEVVTETSVAAGLERFASDDVDCVVSDYDMPDRDGLDFLEAVREDDPSVPFILFTGKGSEAVASEAFSKGATDYLQKQIRSDQATLLANRVVNYVETARSERKRRRHLQAIQTAQEGIAILDEEGTFTFVNEACADLYGYDPAEMIGETWELVHEEAELERMTEEVIPTLLEDGEWHGETIGLRADGTTFVEDHTLSRTEGGEFVCSIRDATGHRERQQYEAIFEAMGVGVYALDESGQLIKANEAVAAFLGVDHDELAGHSPAEFFDGEDVAAFESAIRDLVDAEAGATATVEATVEQTSGEELPVEVTLTPLRDDDGAFRGTVGVARDVSERRKRQRELERYETMVETMGDGVFVLDTDGRVIEVNESNVEMVGDPYEDIVGSASQDYFDAEDVDTLERAIRELLADDAQRAATVQATIQRPDGGEVPVEVTLTVLRHEDGTFRGTVGVARDVSERRERQRELERYETLLELMPDTVVVTDMGGTITEIHGYEGWSGYEYDEIVGEDMGKTVVEEDVERAREIVGDLLRSDDRTKATYETQTQRKDGERVPHENHITLLPPDEDGEVPGTMSVLRDISDRVERERELQRQNERLEEFAGIVSHDLRNPLNVAGGRLALAMEECDSEHLEGVAQAHERMEALIEDLLALARESHPAGDVEEVEAGTLAEAALANVETADATVDITASGTVEADESRFKQLVENLLRNAIEHGGQDVTVRVGDLEDGGLFVADDGPGIPAEERDRIFESGYTTDPEGTGFGLSIVREVAEAHGWTVTVTESEAGGARFEIAWCDD